MIEFVILIDFPTVYKNWLPEFSLKSYLFIYGLELITMS
jgi:hypothetical protein